MCGRFGLEYGEDFYPRFKIKNLLPGFKSNFNISPGQELPVILSDQDSNIVQLMKWGFVPHWAQDPKIGYGMFNARIETVQEKPSFRSSFINKRCLIPANFYFEWKEEDGKKFPYYFKLVNEKYFAMAGLYSHWEDKNGNKLNTFTIITSSPSKQVEVVHDRMPVIVKKEMEDIWLNETINSNEFGEIAKSTLELDLEIQKVPEGFILKSDNKPF